MKVQYHSPKDDTYQLYQAYYLYALRECLGDNSVKPVLGSGGFSALLKKVVNRLDSFSYTYGPKFPKVACHVGRYIFNVDGREVNVAIDAHDHRYIWSPDILAWSDVYFKANYWPSENHIRKVVPIINGNGFLDDRHLNILKGLRDVEKTNDLVFISRIWGGAEHNIRLFEALAKVEGKLDLLAIFPEDWNNDLEKEYKKRLDKVGVPHSMNLISTTQLWERCSRARLNILRAGKYHCTPWRMIDLLAMGSAIVADTDLKSEWPDGLIKNKVIASLGLDRPMDTSASPQEQYDGIAEKVKKLLDDSIKIKDLMKQSAYYYDAYANPKSVGQYLLEQVIHWSTQEKISV